MCLRSDNTLQQHAAVYEVPYNNLRALRSSQQREAVQDVPQLGLVLLEALGRGANKQRKHLAVLHGNAAQVALVLRVACM